MIKTMPLFLCIYFSIGCATYQHKVYEARNLLEQGQPDSAALRLKDLAQEPGKDQLVYLFDYATALQLAGKYQESNESYLLADKLIDLKDYHSISKQTASLLTSENMVQYKGEFYEKVLVNAMLAINFLMLNDLDAALVEAKRVNEKLTLFQVDGEKKYHQNEFALYLSALIWEANKEWDDAYIAYNDVYKLNPQLPELKNDLIRLSQKAKRSAALKKWQKEFGLKPNKTWNDKKYGEVVVIYLQGWAPRKQPHPDSYHFPYLTSVSSYIHGLKVVATPKVGEAKIEGSSGRETANVDVDELLKQGSQTDSFAVYDLESRAMRTFNDAQGALIAKRMAALVAKKAVADRVRKDNEGLGSLLHLAMLISDQADLRQWSTLPESFQVARLWLPVGEYDLHLINKSYSGELLNSSRSRPVVVRSGKKTFVFYRTF